MENMTVSYSFEAPCRGLIKMASPTGQLVQMVMTDKGIKTMEEYLLSLFSNARKKRSLWSLLWRGV
jgi:hypothetical protein